MQSINLFFPFSNLGQVVSAWMIFRIGATLVPIIVFLSYGRNGKSSQHLEDPKSKTWIQIIVWDQMETNWIVVTQKPFGFCKKNFVSTCRLMIKKNPSSRSRPVVSFFVGHPELSISSFLCNIQTPKFELCISID